jgi:hypothetical protein
MAAPSHPVQIYFPAEIKITSGFNFALMDTVNEPR